MKRGTEKAIESSQTAFFVRRFAYQTLYIRDVAWKFPLFPTNDIFYSNSDPWQICYCHQTREEKDMYSCKYKTQKEMVDNKTVFFVKMKTQIFWGIFLGFSLLFPIFCSDWLTGCWRSLISCRDGWLLLLFKDSAWLRERLSQMPYSSL